MEQGKPKVDPHDFFEELRQRGVLGATGVEMVYTICADSQQISKQKLLELKGAIQSGHFQLEQALQTLDDRQRRAIQTALNIFGSDERPDVFPEEGSVLSPVTEEDIYLGKLMTIYTQVFNQDDALFTSIFGETMLGLIKPLVHIEHKAGK